jgi:hypothetical protein
MRYTMNMWTRFNIAESAVHKVRDHFSNDWEVISQKLDQMPVEEIANSLGWSDYNQKYEAQS